MIWEILTLFPGVFESPLQQSMIKRAIESGSVRINVVNIRDFAAGKHAQADDRPYGGGSGMVLKVEPVVAAIRSLNRDPDNPRPHVVLLSPQGTLFNQRKAIEFSRYERIALVCGHYEGVDERVAAHYVDEELSIGDYILTGGEIAALVVIDSVIRLIPGVLGNVDSLSEESFSGSFVEYPHYTRPRKFEGYGVPEVLLSGNHQEIRLWRRQQSLMRTLERRPDLLDLVRDNKTAASPRNQE